MSRYSNLEESRKKFRKASFSVITQEIINWDKSLIKKLDNNGRFSQLDVDYLCQLLKDDITFMKDYQKKHNL